MAKKKSKEEVRLVIAGSRSIEDYEIVKKAIEKGIKELKISVSDIVQVVSGNAKGVDRLGEKWAHENKIPVVLFIPEWDNIDRAGAKVATNNWGKKYDKMAGFHRNFQMADHATHLIAVNEGTNGTDNMVENMQDLEKPYFEEKISKKDEDFTHAF
jgi:predicted Rossmann-fold nucleotide-binding protein